MKETPSYADLYNYLVCLDEWLARHGSECLAQSVRQASLFASGSSPSEFLQEAEQALGCVLSYPSILDDEKRSEIRAWLVSINAGFNSVGGA
jgi:hypothetical protein